MNWKNIDGSWSTLNITEFSVIAKAVANHVASCFDAELAHSLAIDTLTEANDLFVYDMSTGWPDNGIGVTVTPIV
jgi:hypothetical protein